MESEHQSGSTVPPASPGHSRRPGRLVRALRRALAGHWGKILVIWALVTGSLVFVISNRIRPAYESASVLRLGPVADGRFQPGAAMEWEPFLQTQVELIQSAPILSAALAKNAVAATRLVREAKDPESEIRSRLQVNVVPGTYLIRVALISPYPEDGPVIVNQVVAQYVSTASGTVPIKPIAPACTPKAPIRDARRKLLTMTPAGVLAVVLGLFLVAELCSGGVVGSFENPAMRVPRVRLTVRRMMFLVATIALLLTVIIPVGRLSHLARVQRQMYNSISSLQYRVPPGVSRSTWECATGWTVTAYANVCFREEHVTTGEMYRLREDLASELQGPVTPATLVWIWDRLSRTGPLGKQYVAKYKQYFMECFPPGTVSPLDGPDDLLRPSDNSRVVRTTCCLDCEVARGRGSSAAHGMGAAPPAHRAAAPPGQRVVRATRAPSEL